MSRQIADQFLSIVTMAFNEEGNITRLYERLKTVLHDHTDHWELVVVDNGCTDGTLSELKALRASDPRVKFVSLSRNFGAQGGLVAALDHAQGDLVVSMDADLQHPPEMIPQLLEGWGAGYDVVNTKKQTEETVTPLRRFFNYLFYKLVGKLSGIPLKDRQSDYRLMNRAALDAMLSLPEKSKFVRGLSYWIGFSQTTIPYTPEARTIGKTKFRLQHLLGFTLNGIVSFSTIPLRAFMVAGVAISSAALIYAFIMLIEFLVASSPEEMPDGLASILVGIYFLGGIQLLGLGVIGEYVGRVLSETHARPTYIVRESQLDGPGGPHE